MTMTEIIQEQKKKKVRTYYNILRTMKYYAVV